MLKLLSCVGSPPGVAVRVALAARTENVCVAATAGAAVVDVATYPQIV
jgi:hypothetical protein